MLRNADWVQFFVLKSNIVISPLRDQTIATSSLATETNEDDSIVEFWCKVLLTIE